MCNSRNAASLGDTTGPQRSLWRRLLLGKDKEIGVPEAADVPIQTHGHHKQGGQDGPKVGFIRRASRKVVPGLPKVATFRRQQSELRANLEPNVPTPAERRAVSLDRRRRGRKLTQSEPSNSAPDLTEQVHSLHLPAPHSPTRLSKERFEEKTRLINGYRPETNSEAAAEDVDWCHPYRPFQVPDGSAADTQSMATSRYEAILRQELEHTWILNLSMHFKDRSKREKFFVTYRVKDTVWRRVTVSVDYRDAPEGSLEMDLVETRFQREKSAKIYEAIRESLPDIQFYDTVTNLKLQTTDGRLHVHVVEDVNEIVNHPPVNAIQHLRCRRVKEREIGFDSHMAGFVYKVRVNKDVLVKKEIPSSDTVDEFLYEINALDRLRSAKHVIRFYGVVMDDKGEHVKGLLIRYADQGALVDVIYDHAHTLTWTRREKWARQVVHGLSEIHEAGFVQGDFTLANIVIGEDDAAKIIDINRRGCPVGWEPPEAMPLIDNHQRIAMYIGVKSDLYQLGMVLWALAAQEDEPESRGRPLRLRECADAPLWYRRIVEICLCEDPRQRIQALQVLSLFPDPEEDMKYDFQNGYNRQEHLAENHVAYGECKIRTASPSSDWAIGWRHPDDDPWYESPSESDSEQYYPPGGRSPASSMPPLPSDHCGLEYSRCRSSNRYRPANATDVLTTPSVKGDVPLKFMGEMDRTEKDAETDTAARDATRRPMQEVIPVMPDMTGSRERREREKMEAEKGVGIDSSNGATEHGAVSSPGEEEDAEEVPIRKMCGELHEADKRCPPQICSKNEGLGLVLKSRSGSRGHPT